MATAPANEHVRYEAAESCPIPVAFGVGLQGVMLVLAPTVLIVAITVRAAGQDEGYLTWAVFAALVINAIITALQAVQIGRVGSGHMIITGPTVLFVVVMVAALSEGGPGLLASLMVVSALAQFALAAWLPLLRRIITPVVSGTVFMLIAATVLPVAFDRLEELPEGAPPLAGPFVALVTLTLTVALALRASGAWRLWTPLISITLGSALTALLGHYEIQRVFDAPWIGIPERRLPGFDLTPGVEFWALLPTFVILTLVLGIKTISDGVIVQQASQRNPRAIDFRQVQGTVNANGVGMVLAGIAGTLPTSAYSPFSQSLISLTGVAARRVGYAVAGIFLLMALFPKFAAVLLTIPGPVLGAYLLMIMGMFFVGGVRAVVQDGLDQRKAMVVGLAFAIGVGLHENELVTEVLGGAWGTLLGNGVMSGTLVAIVLTLVIELTNARRRRLKIPLDFGALPEIDAFLRELAASIGWNEASTERLRSAGEEALSSLLLSGDDSEGESTPRLIIVASPGDNAVELEFMAVFDEENLEDRLAYLSDQAGTPEAGEISLRLLRHYASSVQHRKYHGIDIVTVQVEGSR